MRSIVLAFVFGTVAVGCQSGNQQTPTATAPPAEQCAVFGGSMKLDDAQATPVSKVFENPAAYDGKYVRLAGTVTDVCPHKGCWFQMTDAVNRSSETLFVKFQDPATGKLIPTAAVGKPVVAEGILSVREMSEDEARHYKAEAGATADELEKIKGPQKRLVLKDPRAQIAGIAN